MNGSTMNSNRSKNELPDHDVDLESDALWSLLGTAGTASADPAREEASSRFTSETLRRLRIEKSSAKPAWWKPLLAAKPLR